MEGSIVSRKESMSCQSTEIYSIRFKTMSPKKMHTFWFTDLDMASLFNESLILHPKVTECHVYAIQANTNSVFTRDPASGGIREIEMWERGRGFSRRFGSIIEYQAAEAAERNHI